MPWRGPKNSPPQLNTYKRDFQGSDASFWAARHGRIETLERTNAYGLNIKTPECGCEGVYSKDNDKEPRNLTTIQEAVLQGYGEVVTWLVAHGLEIDSPPAFQPNGVDRRDSALFTALAARRYSIAFPLLQRGAAVHFAVAREEANFAHKKLETVSALHFAAKFGPLSVLRYLLQVGMDANVKGVDQSTPLHYAAEAWGCPGSTAIIQTLLDHGADINAVTTSYFRKFFNKTALCSAISAGCYRNATALVQAGAYVNFKDGTPLQQCIYEAPRLSSACLGEGPCLEDGKYDFMRLLIERGADLHALIYDNFSNNQSTPLGLAIHYSTAHAFGILLESDVKMKDVGGGLSAVAHSWNTAMNHPDHWEENDTIHRAPKLAVLLAHGARLDENSTYGAKGFLERAIDYVAWDCKPPQPIDCVLDYQWRIMRMIRM